MNMIAKISGNALKHGRTTCSVLCQGSLQQQKYKAALMSRRTAIDQKVCGWDGRNLNYLQCWCNWTRAV